MATVREIMSTHLITIGVGDSLADARALVEAGNLVGLVTEADFVALALRQLEG